MEAGDGEAEDLLRAVADEALRARVPAEHVALRVQHQDRVFLDPVHEQAEALLAQAQVVVGALEPRRIQGQLSNPFVGWSYESLRPQS